MNLQDAYSDLNDSYQEDAITVLSPLDALTHDELTDRRNYKSKNKADKTDVDELKHETKMLLRLTPAQRERYKRLKEAGRD